MKEKLISTNPGKNYEIIGHVDISSNEEITNKVNKAKLAQPNWESIGLENRVNLLDELYNLFVENKDKISLIASKEMGMPVTVNNQIDVDVGLQFMRGYLDNAKKWLSHEIIFENEKEIHYQYYEAKGVAGISIPWNYPFCNFIWAVIQNLVVGNTVVAKHSENCPLTSKLLEEIINASNLPDGVFNQVYGNGPQVGEFLLESNIDIIWFTGSTAVGKHLYKLAAEKFIPIVLELGGSAPGIVFKDANIDMAVESICFNRFINSGQTCDGLKRLIVHKTIFNLVVEKLTKLLSTKKFGDPQDKTTDIGPVVSERQLNNLQQQFNDAIEKGAKVVIGGKRPNNLYGAYFEPTILTDIKFDMKVWKEEVFGPILPIVSFETTQEAINLANDTTYGLGTFIYTNDSQVALNVAKQLKTGNININTANYNIATDPFGGYKDSGIGREHGRSGLQELCNIKVVAITK